MKKLLVLSGLGLGLYALYATAFKKYSTALDMNTFSITGVKNLKPGFGTTKFDIQADYINNTDISLPIDSIVVKVYRLNNGKEEEIAVSRPNNGVNIKPKDVTKITIPMSLSTTSLTSLFKSSTLRIRAWITVQGIVVEDQTDINL